jgi:O-antigen/teichoic acid export membrane protein
MAEKLWMIPESITVILFPRFASLDLDKASKLAPKVSRFTFSIILFIALISLIFVKLGIKLLYGPEYLPAVKPFILLLPGIISLGVCRIFSSYISARGKPGLITIANILSFIVNLPLIFYLIPKWGIAGAAVASTLAYIVTTIVVSILFLKMTKGSFSNSFIITPDDIRNYVLPKLKSLRHIFTY